jgi:hypothetical protein
MTDETGRLIREIRTRSQKVKSAFGTYESAVRLRLMPLAVQGRFYFMSPKRCRSESVVDKSEIISVRNGDTVERRLPQRKEIWKYNLRELPEELPFNYSIADFCDHFFAVEEHSIISDGPETLGEAAVQKFSAKPRNWPGLGMLDTRKGFSIPYQPKNLEMQMGLYISADTGLLRRLVGTDAAGEVIVQADYHIEGINVALDEFLFAMAESAAAYKSIDITDTMLAAFNPDLAEGPPSLN